MKNEILPILTKQNGFLEVLPFFPEKNRGEKALTVSLWATLPDAERYEREVYPKVHEILRPYLNTPITVKPYIVEITLCEHFVEQAKTVLLSVTEGEDKPLKYPSIFFKSELMILNKIDLLPYVPFNAGAAVQNARRIHPGIEVVEVSCTTGAGLHSWMNWIGKRRDAAQSVAVKTTA